MAEEILDPRIENKYVIDGNVVSEYDFNLLRGSVVLESPSKVVRNKPDEYGLRPHSDWFGHTVINGVSNSNFLVVSHFGCMYEQVIKSFPPGATPDKKQLVTLHVHTINQFAQPGLPDQVLINKATSKLFRTSQRYFENDYGVEAAEFRQNLQIIKDTVNTIRSAKRALRRGDLLTVSKLLKISIDVVGAPWLLYRYGIKPLLSSIQGLALDMNYVSYQKTRKVKSFTANVWDEESVDCRQAVDYRFDHNLSVRSRVFCKHSLECIREPIDMDTASDVITWLNPVAIAWEILPYSFVIDWFVDLGSFFEQMSTDYKIEGLHSSTTRGGTFIANANPVWTKDLSDYNITIIEEFAATTEVIGTSFTRENLHGNSPALLPTFNIELSTEQLLDSVALLLQRIKL